MTGQERRDAMIEMIRNSEKPVSGTALAKEFAVSRQVIVQDIALIRAAGYEVLSTISMTDNYQLSLKHESENNNNISDKTIQPSTIIDETVVDL